MQLFLVTALDGDMNVFVFCYALALVENTENWEWFLSLMKEAIYGVEDLDNHLFCS